MANPILNDKRWNEAAKNPGWGAPDPDTRRTPITDGPVSPWHSEVMTVSGTLTASGVLMVILLAFAVVGWQMAPESVPGEVTKFPFLAIGGVLVGFGGALRRAELVGLDIAERASDGTGSVELGPEGARITLHISKTDQEGKGLL